MYINARQLGNGPRCLADISKCRFSALYENVYPIPVYSPQDTIEPFRGELADYMWVDKGVPSSHSAMFACLPYQGPRWYDQQWSADAGVLPAWLVSTVDTRNDAADAAKFLMRWKDTVITVEVGEDLECDLPPQGPGDRGKFSEVAAD